MPTPITPVPTFDTPLTVAGTDSPNSAGMLEVLQTHANRAEYLYQMRKRQPAFRRFYTPGRAAVVHERAGYVIMMRALAYDLISLVSPDASDATSFGVFGNAYSDGDPAGAITRGAYNGGDWAAFVDGGYCHRFSVLLNEARFALASITDAADVIWSAYGEQFVAVGGAAGPVGRIDTSATGQTWAERVTGRSAGNAYSLVAADPTGQYILAAPTSGQVWAYSADGGDTWATPSVELSSDTEYTVTGLSYDATRALWLFTLARADHATGYSWVWSCANPALLASYQVIGTQVLTRGPFNIQAAYGIAAVDGAWYVGTSGLADGGNILITEDAAATWPRALGWGSTDAAGLMLRQSGPYLMVGNNTYVYAISERLAP